MSVVHVANLEAGTLARQAAGAQRAHTALVGNLGQRVGLVHELRQCVGAEEGVDYARDGLGIDQLGGCEHLVVAHIHALTDGACHASQAYAKLVVELLTHGAHAAVAQVVDIVDIGVVVDQANKVLDDFDDIFLGEHTHVHRGLKRQLLVDAETAHVTQVVALLAKEEVVDHLAGACIIGWLSVAQLPVDVVDGLLLRVARVLRQGVEDNLVVARVDVLLVNEDGLHATVQNLLYVLLLNHGVAVDDHIVTLDRHHLAGVLVNEVLVP